MALDFPNAPTVGDVFERWRWDSEKWIPTASTSTPFLPLAGGTMTGPIVLAGWATGNLEAVPLQQVVSRLQSYLPLTGGTLSGSLNVTGNVVATALVQGANVNATGNLTGGNISTAGGVTAAAANIPTFYNNPTFTGSVTVNGNISTPNGVYAAVVQAGTYAGNVTMTGSVVVNGNLQTLNTMTAGAVTTPQLNGNVYCTGNTNAAGQVQGNSLYARDRVDAGGGIFAGNLVQSNRGDDLAFYAPYGGITVATALVSNRGGGQLALYCPYGEAAIGGTVSAGAFNTGGNLNANGVYGNYVRSWGNADVSGGLGVGGNISTGNGVYAGYLHSSGTVDGGYITSTGNVNANADLTGNRVYANYIESRGDLRGTSQVVSNNNIYVQNDGNFSLSDNGSDRFLGYMSGWTLSCSRSNGWLIWWNPGGMNYIWGADGFCYSNINSSGGRGEYVNFSDRRFKDAATITPTTRGLAEILLLNPVEFQRLPPAPPSAFMDLPEGAPPPGESAPSPDTPPPLWELGFIAQEVADVIPEAVNIIGVPLPDGTGGRDTEEPSLGMTTGAIVPVLVNAIKELNARILVLEGV